MSSLLQTILVLTLVGLCVLYVARGAWRTMKLRSGGIGKCCEKGCGASTSQPAEPKNRTVFMPAENLSLRRK